MRFSTVSRKDLGKQMKYTESRAMEAFIEYTDYNVDIPFEDFDEDDFIAGYEAGYVEAEEEYEGKIKAIEALMHPGYWSALDGRREKILRVLESKKMIWDEDPYVE